MSDSEIVAKFGADTSGFDRALRGMNQGLNQAASEGSLHFGRVAKSGKEFKHLLGEISSESGAAGAALKFAFSPLAGILAAATAGFAALKEHIGSINANSDRLEKGTADPVFKMADALQEAKKRLAEFEEQYSHWQKTQGQKGPSQKLTEHLKDQLDLLEKQVGVAEKLSSKDKDRLEHQKLLVTHGLMGRALTQSTHQIIDDQEAVKAAAAKNRSVLGSTALESAQAAIAADEQQLEKLKGSKEAAQKNVNPGFWSQFYHDYIGGPQVGFRPGSLQADADRSLTDINQQIAAAEGRVRRNRGVVAREQAARRAAANGLSEAQGRLGASTAAGEGIRQSMNDVARSIMVSGGFPAAATDDPMTRLANATADWQGRYNDWSKSHGMGDMFSAPSKKAQQDPTSKNIEDLNAMFKAIIDPGTGMKVNMTVQDE